MMAKKLTGVVCEQPSGKSIKPVVDTQSGNVLLKTMLNFLLSAILRS